MKRVSTALIFVCATAISHADEFLDTYSNLAPGDFGFDTGTSYAIRGTNSPSPQSVAHQFTSSLTGKFAYVMFAVTGQEPCNIDLLSDDGAGNVGSLLKRLQGSFEVIPTLYAGFDPSHSIDMVAGQKYWLRVTGEPQFVGGWNWNSTGAIGRQAISTNGDVSYTYLENQAEGAFAVGILKPVPEPATLSVLGLGALALLRRRRK